MSSADSTFPELLEKVSKLDPFLLENRLLIKVKDSYFSITREKLADHKHSLLYLMFTENKIAPIKESKRNDDNSISLDCDVDVFRVIYHYISSGELILKLEQTNSKSFIEKLIDLCDKLLLTKLYKELLKFEEPLIGHKFKCKNIKIIDKNIHLIDYTVYVNDNIIYDEDGKYNYLNCISDIYCGVIHTKQGIIPANEGIDRNGLVTIKFNHEIYFTLLFATLVDRLKFEGRLANNSNKKVILLKNNI